MSEEIESQAQDQTAHTAEEVAASTSQTVEESQDSDASHATPHAAEPEPKELSLQEKMKESASKQKGQQGHKEQENSTQSNDDASDKKPQIAAQGEPPKYEPNFKYKAFGKEKELDPLFKGLIKDPESERKVKEVFTRADAFDDMKSRYEGVSQEFQRVSKTHQDLDRDVKRVMTFRNNGDYDNFFSALQIPKDEIFRYAARQIELEKMSPDQQQAYNQAVSLRAENLYNQQNYASMQAQMSQQRAEMMQMQLDHTLSRSEVTNAASAWDNRMGEGAFRNLVIEEAAKNTYATGQVWTPEQAVQNVMQKFGRLLDSPQPQATVQAQTQNFGQQQPQPQAQGPVVVQGKPVIPNINGRGTSPVKQKPKSLDDLRAMGRAARLADSQAYES